MEGGNLTHSTCHRFSPWIRLSCLWNFNWFLAVYVRGTQWAFSVLLPAPWLLRKRATHAAAVHWNSRRPPAATPCLLPGSPDHRQDCFHHQPWNNTFQHQSPGNPSSSREQHESNVRPRHHVWLLAVSSWSTHLIFNSFNLGFVPFFLYAIFLSLSFFFFPCISLCNSRFPQCCWDKLPLISLTAKQTAQIFMTTDLLSF